MIILWIIGCLVIGIGANSRNRNGIGYFVLALFISPVITFFLLALLPPLEKKEKKSGSGNLLPVLGVLLLSAVIMMTISSFKDHLIKQAQAQTADATSAVIAIDEEPVKDQDQDAPKLEYTDIKAVQRYLESRGFAPGPVDGKLGKRTVAAIKKWQAQEDALASGVISEKLLQDAKATPVTKVVK